MRFLRNGSLDVDYVQGKNCDTGTQSFQAAAFSWGLTMTPTLITPDGCKRSLSFEAIAQLPSFPDLDVVGEIEVSGESATSQLLPTGWACVPDNIEGRAALNLNDGYTKLHLNLFCTETCFERLERIIAAAFSAFGNSITFEVELDYPGHKDPTFWVAQWQIRTLQVLKWTLRTGTQRAKPAKL